MAMRKKDHELIAEELQHVKSFVDKFANTEYNNGKYDTWYTVVILLSAAFEKENPHFEKDKFLQACGLLPQG
jgi:hypothetical protein